MKHRDLLGTPRGDDADARGEHVYPAETPGQAESDPGGPRPKGREAERRAAYVAGADGTEAIPVEPPEEPEDKDRR